MGKDQRAREVAFCSFERRISLGPVGRRRNADYLALLQRFAKRFAGIIVGSCVLPDLCYGRSRHVLSALASHGSLS